MNTRRIGSIVAGPIIAIGSLAVLGQRGIFLISAALTLTGLLIIAISTRTTKPAPTDQAVDGSTQPGVGKELS